MQVCDCWTRQIQDTCTDRDDAVPATYDSLLEKCTHGLPAPHCCVSSPFKSFDTLTCATCGPGLDLSCFIAAASSNNFGRLMQWRPCRVNVRWCCCTNRSIEYKRCQHQYHVTQASYAMPVLLFFYCVNTTRLYQNRALESPCCHVASCARPVGDHKVYIHKLHSTSM